jgi:GT2 family glycosyltransferase
LSNMSLRYIFEPKVGVSVARNSGIKTARGEIILFIDDDVRPAIDWLEKLGTPLVRRESDGVVATIKLAEELQRPWMKRVHKVWLATPDNNGNKEVELTGASMGFHRSVLQRVPGFDPDLGGGARGFGEDSLFTWQLCEAGYSLCRAPGALAVHYLDSFRLLRSQWLVAACKRGQSTAYLFHHWQHGEMKNPLTHIYYFIAKLHLRRILQPPVPLDVEGCAPWEMSYVHTIEMCRQFLKERQHPRNYSKHGLIRLINSRGLRCNIPDLRA